MRAPSRPGRNAVLLIICLLALMVVGISQFVDGSGNRSENEAPEAVETQTSEVSATVTHPSTLDELKAAHATESPPPWAEEEVAGSKLPGNLAVSNGEDSRLLSVRPSFLLEAAKKGSAEKVEILRVSPVVGATHLIRQIGSDLIIAPINHAELVRMRPDWKTVDTLAIKEKVCTEECRLRYGAILEYKDTLFVTLETRGPKVAVFEIDYQSWTIKKSRSYDDRFNAPKGCMTGDGQIALVYRARPDDPEADGPPVLDFLDPATLDRRKSIAIPSTGAVVCIEDQVWVSNYNTPSGDVVSAGGEKLGTFGWNGYGSRSLVFSPSMGRLFGSDHGRDFLFSCDVKSRACQSGPVIQKGSRPTSFAVIENEVFVSLESARSIAVLDAASLRSFGTVGFPGSYGFAGTPLAMIALR